MSSLLHSAVNLQYNDHYSSHCTENTLLYYLVKYRFSKNWPDQQHCNGSHKNR